MILKSSVILLVSTILFFQCYSPARSEQYPDTVPDYKVYKPINRSHDSPCEVRLKGTALDLIHFNGLSEMSLMKIHIEAVKAKECGIIVIATETLIYKNYYKKKMTRDYFFLLFNKLRTSLEDSKTK